MRTSSRLTRWRRSSTNELEKRARPKSGHLDGAVVRHEQIAALQVAVQDAAAVQVVDAARGAERHVQLRRIVERRRARSVQHGVQRAARQILGHQHQVRQLGARAEIEHDVWMPQPAQNRRLAPERAQHCADVERQRVAPLQLARLQRAVDDDVAVVHSACAPGAPARSTAADRWRQTCAIIFAGDLRAALPHGAIHLAVVALFQKLAHVELVGRNLEAVDHGAQRHQRIVVAVAVGCVAVAVVLLRLQHGRLRAAVVHAGRRVRINQLGDGARRRRAVGNALRGAEERRVVGRRHGRVQIGPGTRRRRAAAAGAAARLNRRVLALAAVHENHRRIDVDQLRGVLVAIATHVQRPNQTQLGVVLVRKTARRRRLVARQHFGRIVVIRIRIRIHHMHMLVIIVVIQRHHMACRTRFIERHLVVVQHDLRRAHRVH
jgi:hypothetical protein